MISVGCFARPVLLVVSYSQQPDVQFFPGFLQAVPLDCFSGSRATNSRRHCSTDRESRGCCGAWKVSYPHLSLSIVVSLGYVVSCVSEHTAGLSSASARMMIALPTSMFVVHQLRGRRDVVGVHFPSAATARAEQADIVLLARTRESTYTTQISNGHCICATGRETYVTLSSTPRLTPVRPCVYWSIVEFAGVKDVLVLIRDTAVGSKGFRSSYIGAQSRLQEVMQQC